MGAMNRTQFAGMLNPYERRTMVSTLVTRVLPLFVCLLLLLNVRYGLQPWSSGGDGGGGSAPVAAAELFTDDAALEQPSPELAQLRLEVAKLQALQGQLQEEERQEPPSATAAAAAAAAAAIRTAIATIAAAAATAAAAVAAGGA